MSVTPATKPEIQGPAEEDHRSSRRRQQRALRSSVTSQEGDRPLLQATPGSTFTTVAKCLPLWYTIARRVAFDLGSFHILVCLYRLNDMII